MSQSSHNDAVIQRTARQDCKFPVDTKIFPQLVGGQIPKPKPFPETFTYSDLATYMLQYSELFSKREFNEIISGYRLSRFQRAVRAVVASHYKDQIWSDPRTRQTNMVKELVMANDGDYTFLKHFVGMWPARELLRVRWKNLRKRAESERKERPISVIQNPLPSETNFSVWTEAQRSAFNSNNGAEASSATAQGRSRGPGLSQLRPCFGCVSLHPPSDFKSSKDLYCKLYNLNANGEPQLIQGPRGRTCATWRGAPVRLPGVDTREGQLATLMLEIPSRLNSNADTTPCGDYRIDDDELESRRLREALEKMHRETAALKRRIENHNRTSQSTSFVRLRSTPAPTEIDSEDENVTTPLPPHPEAQEQQRVRLTEGREFKRWFICSVCPYPRPITVKGYGAHSTIICKYCELEMGPEPISEEELLRRRWDCKMWCRQGRHSAPLHAFIDKKHNSHKTCDNCRTVKTRGLMEALEKDIADARREKKKKAKTADSKAKKKARTDKTEKRARAAVAKRSRRSGRTTTPTERLRSSQSQR